MYQEDYKKIFKTSDIAEMTGTHVSTVISEIKKGKLKAIKVGSEYRITLQTLEHYLEIVENNYKTQREIELEEQNCELQNRLQQLEKFITLLKNELLKM